jgi:hypothetical protein
MTPTNALVSNWYRYFASTASNRVSNPDRAQKRRHPQFPSALIARNGVSDEGDGAGGGD